MAESSINGDDGVAPTLQMLPRLRGGGFTDYYLNPQYFDPRFDRDFRNEKVLFDSYRFLILTFFEDDGKVHYRGGHVYYRPYGSLRYAIKVIFFSREALHPSYYYINTTPWISHVLFIFLQVLNKYMDEHNNPDNNWLNKTSSHKRSFLQHLKSTVCFWLKTSMLRYVFVSLILVLDKI